VKLLAIQIKYCIFYYYHNCHKI